jgi:hypothetical protein
MLCDKRSVEPGSPVWTTFRSSPEIHENLLTKDDCLMAKQLGPKNDDDDDGHE